MSIDFKVVVRTMFEVTVEVVVLYIQSSNILALPDNDIEIEIVQHFSF